MEELDLTNGNLSDDDINELKLEKRVNKLILENNKLYKLPIYLLENIEYLDISQNHISKIPDLKEYVKLTVLIVSENIINFIENLPPNLIYLDICNNTLMLFPPCIATLSKLEYLDISHNNMSGPQHYSPNLLHLDISCNDFHEVCNLPPKLKVLKCASTEVHAIDKFPDTLENIDLENNHITVLPRLPNILKRFDISNNNIEVLPNVPDSLEHLDISNNKIKNKEDEFLKIQYFKNEITKVNPIEVNFINGNDTIERYMKQNTSPDIFEDMHMKHDDGPVDINEYLANEHLMCQQIELQKQFELQKEIMREKSTNLILDEIHASPPGLTKLVVEEPTKLTEKLPINILDDMVDLIKEKKERNRRIIIEKLYTSSDDEKILSIVSKPDRYMVDTSIVVIV